MNPHRRLEIQWREMARARDPEVNGVGNIGIDIVPSCHLLSSARICEDVPRTP